MKFLSIAAIVVAAVALTACKPSEAQKKHVKENLPEGCSLYDLGSYGQIDMIVVVRCKSMDATATTTYDSVGKSSERSVAIEIDG